MSLRRHHYEVAFEHYLRGKRVPYVGVNEARRALCGAGGAGGAGGPGATGALVVPDGRGGGRGGKGAGAGAGSAGGGPLKTFDFVLYDRVVPGEDDGRREPLHLLAEVKGRRVTAPRARAAGGGAPRASDDHGAPRGRAEARPAAARAGHLQSWVTRDDVEALRRWQALFGPGFAGAIVFVFWCEDLPPAALFEEFFEHGGRWYAVRAVLADDYAGAMRVRSPKWGTVHLSTADFDRLWRPLAGS